MAETSEQGHKGSLARYIGLWEALQPGLGTQSQGLTCQAGLRVSTVSDETVLALGKQKQAGAPWTPGSWPAVGARPVEFFGKAEARPDSSWTEPCPLPPCLPEDRGSALLYTSSQPGLGQDVGTDGDPKEGGASLSWRQHCFPKGLDPGSPCLETTRL